MLFLLVWNLFIFNCINSDDGYIKVNEALPQFRKRVEEIIDDTGPAVLYTADPSQHIVSFLIKNVKEIFKDSCDDSKTDTVTDLVNDLRREDTTKDDTASIENSDTESVRFTDELTRAFVITEKYQSETESLLPKYRKNVNFFDYPNDETEFNVNALRPILFHEYRVKTDRPPEKHQNNENEVNNFFRKSSFMFTPTLTDTGFQSPTTNFLDIFLTNEYSDWSKKLKTENNQTMPFLMHKSILDQTFLEESITKEYSSSTSISLIYITDLQNKYKSITDFEPTVDEDGTQTSKRKPSCISCDNVADNSCSAPEFELIRSIACERENDDCYSMHTPFGIVDRGCYNADYNMTNYVCGCNICNYIPFRDLPKATSMTKQEWIDNVYELAHLKSMRKSTMNDLLCLNCEVNDTSKGDAVYNMNCLEGNVEALHTVKCEENQICGIKSIKIRHYIWRGCVTFPQYNYYITLCHSDLCNYDQLVSIYDGK